MISSAKEMVVAIANLLHEATDVLTKRRETKPQVTTERDYVLVSYGWQDSAADQIIAHLLPGMKSAGVTPGVERELWKSIRDVLNDVVMYVIEVAPVRDLDRPRPNEEIASQEVRDMVSDIPELKKLVLELPSAQEELAPESSAEDEQKLSKEAKGYICYLYMTGETQSAKAVYNRELKHEDGHEYDEEVYGEFLEDCITSGPNTDIHL